MLLVNDPGDWGHVFAPLEHAAWHGFTPTDLVFPLFLFIVGVSVALGIVPRVQRGDERSALLRAALWRALRVVALGVAINVIAWWLLPDAHLRLPGVLQRIGVCFAVVAAFAIYTGARTQWLAAAALLLGYWALLWSGGSLAPWINLSSRVDSAVFGSYVYQWDALSGRGHDPEGLLGTLPSIAGCLLGLRAGCALRDGRLGALLAAGVIALAIGWAWSLVLPFNKNLWTPSFVLWTTGWSLLLLVLFQWLIGVRDWPAIGRRFGVNAIAAYAGSELMQILLPALGWQEPIYRLGVASWATPLAGPYVASLIYAALFVLLWWGVVWALDRKGIYLRL